MGRYIAESYLQRATICDDYYEGEEDRDEKTGGKMSGGSLKAGKRRKPKITQAIKNQRENET